MKHLLAFPFIFAGIYHIVTIILPTFGEPSPLWRHLLFIGINAMMTILHYLRPKVFFAIACILIIQQVWSHGAYGLKVYQSEQRVDWYSLIIVFGLPVYVWIYYLINLSKKNRHH